MKVNFHYHFYSRLVISLMIFGLGFFLLQFGVKSKAVIPNTYTDGQPVMGWAWNDKIGWVALNCQNDFDGNGEPDGSYTAGTYSCGGSMGAWGLRLANIDHDSNASTPERTYIQGCAWAGGTTIEDSNDPDQSKSLPGWICFSNPVGASTLAPSNGVLVSDGTQTIQYCQCVVKLGRCEGTIRPNAPCSSPSTCSGRLLLGDIGNICEGPLGDRHCSMTPSVSCNERGDDDCLFACSDDTNPSFILKGVCYDHSAAQRSILRANRGATPPFNAALVNLGECYINKDCDNYDHVNPPVDLPECVYPQVGYVTPPAPTQLGKGICKNNDGDTNGIRCAYDFDCGTGYYCEIRIPDDLAKTPIGCDPLQCVGAYEPQYTEVELAYYPNTLNPLGREAEGFASIQKLESVSSIPEYTEANRLGFPLTDSTIVNDGIIFGLDFDADNPNDNPSNPIRGCFNCYREKIYQCLSGPACSCDQSQNSCESTNCQGEDDSCVVSDLVSICDNCQEYFYYKVGDFLNGASSGRVCNMEPHAACDDDNPCPSRDTCGTEIKHVGDFKKVLAGFNCSNCVIDNLDNSCTLNSSAINNNRCGNCEMLYHTTGVVLDNKHGRSSTSTLCGWGYNAWFSDSNMTGLGWFNFSPRITTSTKPYFSVERGNIYSKGRIVTRYQPPINKYNASYLIESGGSITNFVSQSSQNEAFQGEVENRPLINFLEPGSFNPSKFVNALGKLDYTGLVTTDKIVSGISYNKYGGVLKELNAGEASDFIDEFQQPFNNQVYYVPQSVVNDLPNARVVLDGSALEIKRGGTGNVSGAGIIIIEGDLEIKNNITYQDTGDIVKINQIPSLVWVVKGDLIIDPAVSRIAGTFVVLGDGNNSCSNNAVHCGQFKSGDTSSSALIISGNVLARKFLLQRKYVDSMTGAPAEQFINDGRLQTNPPLGLSDISRVIPRFGTY